LMPIAPMPILSFGESLFLIWAKESSGRLVRIPKPAVRAAEFRINNRRDELIAIKVMRSNYKLNGCDNSNGQ